MKTLMHALMIVCCIGGKTTNKISLLSIVVLADGLRRKMAMKMVENQKLLRVYIIFHWLLDCSVCICLAILQMICYGTLKFGQKTGLTLRHPVDSPAWAYLDEKYPYFGNECRNVRLGLANDGFSPFGMSWTIHST